MTLIEVLRKLASCAPSHMKDKTLAGPGLLAQVEPGWYYASDTRCILFVACDERMHWGFPRCGEKQAVHIRPMLEAKPQEWVDVYAGALKGLCQSSAWLESCPSCKGTSKESPYVTCTFCDDDGVVMPEPILARVLDQPVDLVYVGRVLEAFPEDVIKIGVATHPAIKNGTMLILEAPGKRAAIMGMTLHLNAPDQAEKWAAATRFPAPLVENYSHA